MSRRTELGTKAIIDSPVSDADRAVATGVPAPGSRNGTYNPFVRIATSAPTRIDLAGGTIDIWPLYLFHSGAQTVNAAISIRTYARVEPRDDDRIVIHSEDTQATVEADDWPALRNESRLRLLSLLVHFFEARGLTLTTHSESPA